MKLLLEASSNLLIETKKAVVFTILLLSYFYIEHLFTEYQRKFKVVPKNPQFLSASYDPVTSQRL